jgi:hypothetical protein
MTEALIKALERATNNQINLGTANGWRPEDSALYKELREHLIIGTSTERELSRCYYENTFDVSINEQTYKVTYRVDSGD